MSGQDGYITPAALGVPTASERGAESEMAHKWASWLHNPCLLGGPHRFRASWGKLSTEDRTQTLTGHIVGCPICGADEDNLHFLLHCSLIKVAADCINKALGCYIDVHGISHSILQFASTHEGDTLATLPGKVLWTARQARWVTRCLFRFNTLPDTPNTTHFCLYGLKS